MTLWKDLERTETELIKLSPADETEIRKFIEHVRYAAECEIPAEKPMDAMGIGDYIRLGASMKNIPKVMKEYVAHSFLVSYASIASGNGEIPIGGSLTMVNRIVECFRQLGGKLYCNTPVQRILTENGKAMGVELEDHKTVWADYIISSVDTMEMFEHLIGKKYMSKKWKSCYADREKYPLFSAVQAAFVADCRAYDGKGTIFFDCAPFETGGRRVDRISVKSYEYEPQFAPEGKTVLQVNVPQFDKEYAYWKGLTKEGYETQKKEAVSGLWHRAGFLWQ